MKPHKFTTAVSLLALLAGCGDTARKAADKTARAGEKAADKTAEAADKARDKTADVADKAADAVRPGDQSGEYTHRLTEQARRIADMEPAQAKAQLSQFVDNACREVQEVEDSETARKVADDLGNALDQLEDQSEKFGGKIDVSKLERTVATASERFKNDTSVSTKLEDVKDKLDDLKS